MWAVVPFRGALGAKRRLAEHLSPAEREALATAMLRDVLDALLRSGAFAGRLIVSRAPEAAGLAAEFDAEVFAESRDSDLPGALTEASAFLAAERGATGTFVVPADVPLLAVADIEAILDGHENVTLVPDRDDVGTNCAVASPPNAFRYVFDGKSFHPHCAAAREAGFEPRILRLERLGLDVDTVDELRDLIRRGSGTRAYAFLESSGVASRLTAPHNS